MDDDAKIKYRYFVFSFSAAFFILSLTFLFLVATVRPAIPASLTDEPLIEDEASAYVPEKEDALTVLFIGASEDLSAAGTFLLVRFDPVSGEIPVILLPAQTAVYNMGNRETLSEVYRYGGAQYLKDLLSETLSAPVDRYAKINTEAFIKAADMIGFVEFDLPVEISVMRGGAYSNLSTGKQLLNGQKALDVMAHRDYPGGEAQRRSVTGELAAEIINQRMDICLSTVVDNVFEKLVNLISTDISYNDYYNRKPAAEFMAKLSSNPAYSLEAEGELSGDGLHFVLSDAFIAKLSRILH